MSSHNRALIIYTLIALAIYYLIHNQGWSFYVLLAWTLMYLSLIVYASMNMDLNYYFNSVIQGNNSGRGVALTFDDGPDDYTDQVLEILKERNVKATFFCIGKKIAGREDLIKRLDQQGHIIANHSYIHNVVLDFLPHFMIKKDLVKTNTFIEKIIGKKPMLFRPPFGVTTPAMSRTLRQLKMTCVGWNNRSFDTSNFSDELLAKRIQKKLKPGSIILLHDKLSRQKTLLPIILDLIEQESLQVVPLDQLINKQAYV